MGRRRGFNQLPLIQLGQPALRLPPKERSLLVQLVQRLLLEIVLNRTMDRSAEESGNE